MHSSSVFRLSGSNRWSLLLPTFPFFFALGRYIARNTHNIYIQMKWKLAVKGLAPVVFDPQPVRRSFEVGETAEL